MKEIKPFLIVALAALVASKVLQVASPWFAVYLTTDATDETLYMGISSISQSLSWLVFNLVVAIWTFKEANKEDSNPALWFFLSLFLGAMGLILFYSYQSYTKYSENKTSDNQRRLTTPKDAPSAS